MTLCTVQDCGRPRKEREWCHAHYEYWRRRGVPFRPKTAADRFWAKVDQSGDCWEWTAARTQGYGVFRWNGRQGTAYRFAYELLVGPIPAGLTLDHLCRNRGCVNPAHLEPVTAGENTIRGMSVSGINSRKTHCVNGHPFDESNTYYNRGHRHCRTCRMARVYRQRGKAA